MLFTEPLFFVFFAIVFGVYWTLQQGRARKVWLLLASYAFYAAWDWRFLGLIWASTLIDYCAGLGMRRLPVGRKRKKWLLMSLIGNLGLLGFFKYYNFFVGSLNPLFDFLDLGSLQTLNVLLPIGISFYTFQTLSYSIDVYRGRLQPTTDFLDFALFVSFFPQLVMGPILRAAGFISQLDTQKRLGTIRFKALLALFLFGFVKKVCISDNIAPIVDSVYADPSAFSDLGVWVAVLFYSVQLYCDFSAYSDMAIALAGMLGYAVPTNFEFPFFAGNISAFWRRWHISFSSWLRDYLYFPLGGSRAGERRTQANLLITMLLSGLWHGAGANFIVWGGLNGIALIVHRVYQNAALVPTAVRRLFASVGALLTFYWFSLTLIFFRSSTLAEALDVSRSFVLFQSPGTRDLDPLLLLWFVPMAAVHWVGMKFNLPLQAERVTGWVYALGLGFAVSAALAFVKLAYRPFIYFQF